MAWLDYRVNEIHSALFDQKQQSRIPDDNNKTSLNDATLDTVARVTLTERNVGELKHALQGLADDVAKIKEKNG